MISTRAHDLLLEAAGPDGVLSDPEDLVLYQYDGSVDQATPELVFFPRATEEVSRILKICHQYQVPVTARGAGTGLSGGAIPVCGGVIVSLARMKRIVEIDAANLRAVVEPGVVNLDITVAVQNLGLFYAPDPSSQRACTIGGNVAENAGGPHTLAYGVTTNHVLGLEAVLPDGTIVQTGGKECDCPGYDLTGLLTGSEGTMAIVTKVIVRLMRKPEAVKTLLAIYASNEDCGETVSEITARGIVPAACEMMDGVMLRMVEEATHAGYPLDAGAVLLIELEGLREAVEEQVEGVIAACTACNAREVRQARSAEERELLWKGRKNAFGAVGRVVPLTMCRTAWCRAPRSPRRCATSTRWRAKAGSPSATSFTPATGTCIPSSCSTPARRVTWRRRARRARTFYGAVSRWEARSPANTGWAWKRSV